MTSAPAGGNPVLLDYEMTSWPDPIQVSPSPTERSLARLTFVVSCPASTDSCTVSQITIQLPVGDASVATNLTSVPPGQPTISASDRAPWTASSSTVADGLFIFTPPNGSVQFSTQSLTIEVDGIDVSEMVGVTHIVIREWAAKGTGPAPSPQAKPSGQAVIDAPKFPYGFFVSGFTPSATQVARGGTVTLTWQGSPNADYTMTYAGTTVTVPSGEYGNWTSPQLYDTTVFKLTASASEGGQTVRMSLNATVTVSSPQVLAFYADPDAIDYGGQVTLHWRAENADGVYLNTGESEKTPLPAVSDASHPFTLAPAYGTTYSMVAYRHGQDPSPPFQLSLTFNPVVIKKFSADPPALAGDTRSTTLSWEVLSARSVSYQGRKVPSTGSCVETPSASTDYELVATGADGRQVTATATATVYLVQMDGCHLVTLAQKEKSVTATIDFAVANASAVSVSGASMLFGSTGDFYLDCQAQVTKAGPAQWRATLTCADIGGNVLFPCTGLWVTYRAEGIPAAETGSASILYFLDANAEARIRSFPAETWTDADPPARMFPGDRWGLDFLTAAAHAPDGLWPSALAVTAVGTEPAPGPRVYMLSRHDNHVGELAFGGGWHFRDVTADAGAPAAQAGSGLAAMGVGANHDPRVYFLDASAHVGELAWFNSGWHFRDVTADTGAPPARAGSRLAAMGAGAGYAPRVYFLDANGHVGELAALSNGWHFRDVTADTGAPPAQAGSGLTAFGAGQGPDPHVYFVDGGGTLQELYRQGSGWSHREASQAAGPWPDQGVTGQTGRWLGEQPWAWPAPRVYFCNPDGVAEMSWKGAGTAFPET